MVDIILFEIEFKTKSPNTTENFNNVSARFLMLILFGWRIYRQTFDFAKLIHHCSVVSCSIAVGTEAAISEWWEGTF